MSTLKLSRTSGEYQTRVASAFRLAEIALRVAGLDDSGERVSYIKKTNRGYCVKSKSNPNWSGGCYPTEAEAEKRLSEVEMFKHMKKKESSMDLKRIAIVVGESNIYPPLAPIE